jgi:hypothetical protein
VKSFVLGVRWEIESENLRSGSARKLSELIVDMRTFLIRFLGTGDECSLRKYTSTDQLTRFFLKKKINKKIDAE